MHENTIDAIIYLIFGLLVGSFLNVVIYRLPQMMYRSWLHEAGSNISGTTADEKILWAPAVVFGMARAFGEALAIQMVVGNSAVIPTSLTTPAATLTSVLTMGIGNTVMGTVDNNVLWSLALVLLMMSLAFNSVIKLITKERGKKNYAR